MPGKARFTWERFDPLLGTMPDAELATRIGCTRETVYLRRKLLGIAACPGIDWTKWAPLLGTMSDHALARRIGCDRSRVGQQREASGIPAWKSPGEIEWARWDTLLGTMPDHEAATVISCSENAVFKRRKKLEIPPFEPHARPAEVATEEWLKVTLRLEPRDEQRLLARAAAEGISPTLWARRAVQAALQSAEVVVSREKWETIDWTRWGPLLGTMTDQDLAQQIGCAFTAVSRQRRKLQISPHVSPRVDWSQFDALLGTRPDHEIAALASCSISTVFKRRQVLGIEAHRAHSPGEPAGTSPPSAALRQLALRGRGPHRDQRLYERLAQGDLLRTLADEEGVTPEAIRQAALRHARRHDLPYPPPRPPSERGAMAARLRREEGLSWVEIGHRLQVAAETAHHLAKQQAEADGLPLPERIVLERTIRAEEKGALCYQLRVSGLTWAQVAVQSGTKHTPSAVEKARHHAHRQGLPWPIVLE